MTSLKPCSQFNLWVCSRFYGASIETVNETRRALLWQVEGSPPPQLVDRLREADTDGLRAVELTTEEGRAARLGWRPFSFFI